MIEAPFRGVGILHRAAKRAKSHPIVAAFKAVGGQLVAVAAGAALLKAGVEGLANDPQTLPTFIKAGAAIVGGVLSGNIVPLFMAGQNRLEYRRGLFKTKGFDINQPPETYDYSLKDLTAWPRWRASRPSNGNYPPDQPWWP